MGAFYNSAFLFLCSLSTLTLALRGPSLATLPQRPAIASFIFNFFHFVPRGTFCIFFHFLLAILKQSASFLTMKHTYTLRTHLLGTAQQYYVLRLFLGDKLAHVHTSKNYNYIANLSAEWVANDYAVANVG